MPEGRVGLGVHTEPIDVVIRQTPWQAGKTHQSRTKTPTVILDVQADVGVFPGLRARRQMQDMPVSFNPERRDYVVREVVDTTVELRNPRWTEPAAHDPLSLAGEFA